MIHGTARKWGGSHEGMFECARWISGQAPEGHSMHKVVALAHIEMWLDAAKEEQKTYFRSPAVQQEIWAVARKSVLSPAYTRPGSVLSWADRNIYAFCFRLMHEYGAQLEQMRLIGPYITVHPWQYMGNAGQKYEAHRQFAFQQLYGTPAPPWETFAGQAQATA
jgi:hypothetical protein